MRPNVPNAQARDLSSLTGRVTKAHTPDPASPREALQPPRSNASIGSHSSSTGNSSNASIEGKSGNTGIAGSTAITGNNGESTDSAPVVRAERSKLSVYVPTEIADRARSAWRMTGVVPGQEYVSFSAWVSQAIEKAVREAEQELNQGQPFPPTPVGISPTGPAPRL